MYKLNSLLLEELEVKGSNFIRYVYVDVVIDMALNRRLYKMYACITSKLNCVLGISDVI